MVAIFVLLTIAAFVIIDVFVQRAARKKEALAPKPARPVLLDRFVIPKGYFVSRAHAWIEVLKTGIARIGVDDFVQKLVGPIDAVTAIPPGTSVRKGETLLTLQRGGRTLIIPSPLSGTVLEVNSEVLTNADALNADPYGSGWVAILEPASLATELPTTAIASAAVQWLRNEISRFRDFITEYAFRSDTEPLPAGATLLDGGIPVAGVLGMTDDRTWERFEREFLTMQRD